MQRFFFAFVCATMVFLGASSARADSWLCTGSARVQLNSHTWESKPLRANVTATDEKSAKVAALKWARDNMRVMWVEYVKVTCQKVDPAKPAQKPAPTPLPAPKTSKPTNRMWTCRVKTRWHVGARTGDIDETWSDIEAPSEAAAMGQAIFRTQSRAKALSLSGTNPTWSRTEVNCS